MLDHTLLTQLAAEARLLTDDEWGSFRQQNAENRLFNVLRALYPNVFNDAYTDSDDFQKATSDEMIDMALKTLQGLSQTP